jgi:ribosome-associated heat shock protein Hsp15
VIKPHHPVRPGDRLTIRQGRWLRRVTVEQLGERRGPAVEARRLYDEPTAPAAVEGAEPWTPLLDDGSDEDGVGR